MSAQNLDSDIETMLAFNLATVGQLVGVHLTDTFEEKQPCRTSLLSGEDWTQEVLGGNTHRIIECCRMNLQVFEELVSVLTTKNLLVPTRSCSVEQQVLIFLYITGQNASNRNAQERFQHSGETISRHFDSVLKALVALAPEYIKLPDPLVIPQEISTNPKFFPYFKDCIGAIDGTHIPASITSNQQAPFRNRKGFISQNILAACSFDLLFLYILAGWEGSANDGRVLQDALEKDFHVPDGKYYLADAGYGNTPRFLVPYRGVRYHLKEWAQGNTR